MGRHEKEKMRGSFGRLMTPGDCELWTMSGLLYLRPTKQTEHMLESPSGTGTVRCRYGGYSGLWRGGEVHGNMVLQSTLHFRRIQAYLHPCKG